mmetsp:Transcript_32823/g.105216  ORF Transcript_32823/g.105216 Transcript_32823/m.105216 type:complete len:212 (-) Transcript_32823:39-674(-)
MRALLPGEPRLLRLPLHKLCAPLLRQIDDLAEPNQGHLGHAAHGRRRLLVKVDLGVPSVLAAHVLVRKSVQVRVPLRVQLAARPASATAALQDRRLCGGIPLLRQPVLPLLLVVLLAAVALAAPPAAAPSPAGRRPVRPTGRRRPTGEQGTVLLLEPALARVRLRQLGLHRGQCSLGGRLQQCHWQRRRRRLRAREHARDEGPAKHKLAQA